MRGLRRGLGTYFSLSGGPWGPPGKLLGPPWEPLGAPGTTLGALWAAFEKLLGAFWNPLGAFRELFGTPRVLFDSFVQTLGCFAKFFSIFRICFRRRTCEITWGKSVANLGQA